MNTTTRHSPTAKAAKLLATAFGALLSTGLYSCSDDDSADEPRMATLYDVVEVTSHTSTATVFTLWKPDASEPATLTAKEMPIDLSSIPAGDCVFLGYTPLNGKAHTSGEITVQACGAVNNSTLQKAAPEKIEGWDTEPIYLMSLWRAGNKLCVRMRITYDTHPRTLVLVGDETTAADPYPTAYLYHRRSNSTPNFSRQYYAAFDLSSLWSTPGCKGLKVRVCNSNIPSLNEFIIENPTPTDGE